MMEEKTPETTAGPNGSYTGGGIRSHSILIVLFLIYMSDYADRMVVTSMFEFIKRDWNISDAQAGWLVSIVVLFITVFTIPAALLIDRWSRRKMVAIMVFFWSLATLSCAFTKTYTQLLVARAFIGIGEAGYGPGGTAMLAGAYPEEKRARTMGIWNAAIPLGAGIGMMAGGMIAGKWGWHHAFGVVAVPGMLLAVAAWFLPDYKNVRASDVSNESGSGSGYVHNALALFRVPSLMCAYMGFAMNVAATTALMSWMPTYFERTGLADAGKGGVYATPIFAMVFLGAPLGGFISDRWYKKSKQARMVFPAITSASSSLILLAALLNAGNSYQVPILILFGITVTCFIAPAISVTQDVVHPGVRALSFGMCVIVQHVCGDIWSPPLIGKLSDTMGIEKAMLFIPVFGLLAGVFFIIGSRFYVRDLGRVEKVQLEQE